MVKVQENNNITKVLKKAGMKLKKMRIKHNEY